MIGPTRHQDLNIIATSRIAAWKAELQPSNSGIDSTENNVISVCYLDAEDESTFRNFRYLRLSFPLISCFGFPARPPAKNEKWLGISSFGQVLLTFESLGYIPNETQNTVILIFPGFILIDDFHPEYGLGYPGSWRNRRCLCPPDRPSFFHHLHGGPHILVETARACSRKRLAADTTFSILFHPVESGRISGSLIG